MTARPAGRLVVAVTGASGAPYAVRVLQLLHARRDYEVHLVISHAGATKYEAGFIGSSVSVGMLIGALGIGFVADRVGRKLAFMLGMAIYSVLSLVLCLTWNYESLLVLRMVQGIGLGAEAPLVFTYLAEFMPARIRGRLVATSIFGWVFASAIAALVAIPVLAGAIAPTALGYVLGHTASTFGFFSIIGAGELVAAVLAFFFCFEGRGKTLEEISAALTVPRVLS